MIDAESSALEIAAAVASGAASAREITRAALDRIDRLDVKYNCFTGITRDRALAEAEAVDAKRAALRHDAVPGEALPPLAGVPYAVKNLADIDGLATLPGSKINRDRPPASRRGF